MVAGFGLFYATADGRSLAALGLSDLGVVLGSIGLAAFLVKFGGLLGVAMESRVLTKMVLICPFADSEELVLLFDFRRHGGSSGIVDIPTCEAYSLVRHNRQRVVRCKRCR